MGGTLAKPTLCCAKTRTQSGILDGSYANCADNGAATGESTALRQEQDGNTPTELNECVHQLYAPAVGFPAFDIVFFHGLQPVGGYKDAWRSTWVSRVEGQDGSTACLWPQAWLPRDFPNARILSVSYDSCACKFYGGQGKMDMLQTGEYLVQQLISHSEVRLGARPVVLVGHSLGGIVLKQLFIEAAKQAASHTQQSKRCADFVTNLAGVFFYATPHGGAGLAGLAQTALSVLGGDAPVLQYLQVLGKETARLNMEFVNRLRDRQHLDLVAAYETKPTKSVMVVEEASARQGMHTAVAAPYNHTDICRPQTQKDMRYAMLVDYINNSLEVPKLTVAGPLGPFGVEAIVKQALGLKGQGVAIYGTGGMGKSTLAKALYDEQSQNYVMGRTVTVQLGYDASTSVVDTRTFDGYLLQMGIKPTSSNCATLLSKQLQEGRLLLLLDNFSTIPQLQQVLPPNCSLGPGSYLILTTRDKGLANYITKGAMDGVTTPQGGIKIFRMPPMSPAAAEQLFRSRTRHSGSSEFLARPGMQKLEADIIARCSGMPLALEMVGSALHNQDEAAWQVAYSKLKDGGFTECEQFMAQEGSADPRLDMLIQWSLQSLKEEVQDMFYDAATVLLGELETTVIMLWQARFGTDESSIRGRLLQLRQRCLISEGTSDGVLRVHDVLVMVARDAVATGRRKDTRLLTLQHLPVDQELLQKVQLLRGCGGMLGSGLLPQLRKLEVALDVTAEAPSSIPDDGQLQQATGFKHLKSRLKWLRSSSFSIRIVQELTQLVVLDLASSSELAALPAECSKLQHLQHLDLSNCDSLTDIRPVTAMTKLRFLDVSGCSSLVELPDLGELQGLEELLLHQCTSITWLPESTSQLSKLKVLQLSRCRKLEALPDLSSLTSLTSVHVSCCNALQQLPPLVVAVHRSKPEVGFNELKKISMIPSTLGQLTAVTNLNLSNCSCLETLPDAVGSLKLLRVLYLDEASSLTKLPDTFTELGALQVLQLSDCSSLKRLPDGFGALSSLSWLDLNGCSSLQHLPDSCTSLTALSAVDLRRCQGFANAADMKAFEHPVIFEAYQSTLDRALVQRMEDGTLQFKLSFAMVKCTIEGYQAETIKDMVQRLCSTYVLKQLGHVQARNLFARQLVDEVVEKYGGSAVCCGVPYELKPDLEQDGLQEAVKTCSLQFTARLLGVQSLSSLPMVGRFTSCLDYSLLSLKYELLFIPERAKPFVFKRCGDGGYINWAFNGHVQRGGGECREKEKFLYFPDEKDCLTAGLPLVWTDSNV